MPPQMQMPFQDQYVERNLTMARENIAESDEWLEAALLGKLDGQDLDMYARLEAANRAAASLQIAQSQANMAAQMIHEFIVKTGYVPPKPKPAPAAAASAGGSSATGAAVPAAGQKTA